MMLLRLVGLVFCLVSVNTFADDKMLAKPEVKEFIQEMVKKDHFSSSQVTQIIRQAQMQPIIIEKMSMPYEGKPWDVYQNLFLTSHRIHEGVLFWKKNAGVLAFAEKKYGVPANIIVGILGVETTYGRQQGTFRVLDALTTLAFYYPKRSPYFMYELRQYLIMCRDYHLDPTAQIGSYAGAMGQGQFMPSSYRRWAVSYKGHAAPDIVNNADDAIVSVANYLSQHGWHKGEEIAQKTLSHSTNCSHLQVNAKKALYTTSELSRCGFKTEQLSWSVPKQAGVIELMMSQQPNEYWIGYPNFYVILTYNSSPLYGLAVYLLGSSIHAQV